MSDSYQAIYEALTTGIEWQATRGHTLDADDYGNELRSLKR